jgi:hypothetical protein
VWAARAQRHRERAERFLATHRAPPGGRHPVWDFLFTYYSLRPGRLRRWHPGHGVALAGPAATEYSGRTGYVTASGGVTVGGQYLMARLPTVRFVAGLLHATASRPARFGCFGMHEWAMVYRAGARRHTAAPLRLGRAGSDAVVESMPLRCTHFDAFRFFTSAAVGRNEAPLTRSGQAESEQPGCLHANMDLFKWCHKLGPLVASELLMDCLELAACARELDMRASPYDLSEYGFEPVAVEEPAGRAEYVRRQSLLAERAAPLRAALLTACEDLLESAADRIEPPHQG